MSGVRLCLPNGASAHPFSYASAYSQAPLRPAVMLTWPLPQWVRHLYLPGPSLDPT
jgi:hypothetical protein